MFPIAKQVTLFVDDIINYIMRPTKTTLVNKYVIRMPA